MPCYPGHGIAAGLSYCRGRKMVMERHASFDRGHRGSRQSWQLRFSSRFAMFPSWEISRTRSASIPGPIRYLSVTWKTLRCRHLPIFDCLWRWLLRRCWWVSLGTLWARSVIARCWLRRLMMVLFFQAARLAMVAFDPFLSSRQLAEVLNREPEGTLDRRPSLLLVFVGVLLYEPAGVALKRSI